MTKNDISSASSVDLNTGTKAEILELPGIGEVYAGRIIDNRPYKDIEDFKVRSGLSQKVIDKISDMIVVH
jgi:competence protein ComEA